MHVAGDRTTPHGLATVGYDDEGVAAQTFDIVRDGVLVGLPARPAHRGRARLRPVQRLRLRRLPAPRPHPAHGQRVAAARTRGRARPPRSSSPASTGASTWSATRAGPSTCSATTSSSPASASTGSSTAAWRASSRDVAYQAQTTEFWGALEAVGGRVDLRARWRLQLREGPAGSSRPGEPRLPVGALPRDPRAQRPRGDPTVTGRRLPPPDEVVERALAASRFEDCAVIVEETSEAEVRFANNTTTTSGVRRDRRVAVVSFRAVGPGDDGGSSPTPGPATGMAAGEASRSGDVDVVDLVRASEAEARHAPPAEDAAPLVAGRRRPRFRRVAAVHRHRPPAPGRSASSARAFGRARAEGRVLAGFATHSISTLYVGTSTGLRRPPCPGPGDHGACRAHARRPAFGVGRRGHRGLRRRRRRGHGPPADRAPALGGADGRAARRALRGGAAPRRRGRPHGAAVRGHVGPRCRGRPQRLRPARRGDQGRGAPRLAALGAARRPGRAGPGVHPVRCHRRVGDRRLGVRQRARDRADALGGGRATVASSLPPGRPRPRRVRRRLRRSAT